MVVMTGIHGNEWAGLFAARRVLDRLHEDEIPILGELTVLAGNLSAIKERTRFIDDDLNRNWTSARVEALRSVSDFRGRPEEDRQRQQLVETFVEIVGKARGQVHFLDLHTSSADGAPFLTVGDTLRNRAFAMNFPLPIMLGLEEQVDDSLLEYLNNFGFVTMGVEAGRHDADHAIDRHEAVLWLALVAAGIIEERSTPQPQRCRAMLREASSGIPRILEVRHRHPIRPGDGFRMEPGFGNFDTVRKDQLLAHDVRGPIYAEASGRILLPLYQGKGDDGFFVAREVRAFWLELSAMLRRLWLGALIRYLPGVRRHPELQDVLIVNLRIARIYPLEIFHLFGYRKLRRIGAALIVSRRRYDVTPPDQISFS